MNDSTANLFLLGLEKAVDMPSLKYAILEKYGPKALVREFHLIYYIINFKDMHSVMKSILWNHLLT